MPERLQPQPDRPRLIIQKLLGNPVELHHLLDVKGGQRAQVRARNAMRNFTPHEVTLLAGQLIYAQSQEHTFWNEDRRVAALRLLEQVPLEKAKPEILRDVYLRAIHNQGEVTDAPGRIDALMDVGKVIFNYLPQDEVTQQAVGKAWDSVSSRMKDSLVLPVVEQKAAKAKIIFQEEIEKRRRQEALEFEEDNAIPDYSEVFENDKETVDDDILTLRKQEKAVDYRRRIGLRRDHVLAQQRSGKSHAEIARALSIPKYIVQQDLNYFRKRGDKVDNSSPKSVKVAERRQYVATLWEQEMPSKQIAKKLGVSISIVNRDVAHLREQGEKLKRRWVRKSDTEFALRRQHAATLWEQEMSIKQIAEKMGVSEKVIINDLTYLRNQGEKLRKGRASTTQLAARRKLVLELRRSGKSHAEIAEDLRITLNMVNNDIIRIRQSGEKLERRASKKNHTAQRRRLQVKTFLEQGKSRQDIIIELGMSPNKFRSDLSYLRKQGMKIEKKTGNSASPEVIARRQQVAELLKLGKKPTQIATELGVALKLVENDIYISETRRNKSDIS